MAKYSFRLKNNLKTKKISVQKLSLVLISLLFTFVSKTVMKVVRKHTIDNIFTISFFRL